jgi:hypothetical protein
MGFAVGKLRDRRCHVCVAHFDAGAQMERPAEQLLSVLNVVQALAPSQAGHDTSSSALDSGVLAAVGAEEEAWADLRSAMWAGS